MNVATSTWANLQANARASSMCATGFDGTRVHGVETSGTAGWSVVASTIIARTCSNRPNAAAVTMVSTLAPRHTSASAGSM